MGYSTIGEIIKECCDAIWETLQPIYMPKSNEEQWIKIAKAFSEKWNYPNCVGALDGKHVHLKCPAKSGSLFYNYKGSYSIVLLALVDANYKFILVDVGAHGKSSDGGTYERSDMCKKFVNNEYGIPQSEQLPHVIVADEAFPLKPYLMRLYSRAAIVSDEEKIYNYRHSRARRTVESAFGILAGRWRVFLKPIATNLQTADKIILAAICLHNMLRNTASSISPFEEKIIINNEVIQGVANLGLIRRNYIREAVAIRDKFKKYFVSPNGSASCPWEWDSIRKGRI
ncbi:uncharacterized protein LOC128882733 [Hylaeus volcanicus]|uniref:uncharacterized protein LOC128882733 n=1 Tax=Hylaeus volcanicus TaxID=313075 RepID=UPI0023B7AE85|nr:uncharacterized protein LOC128882733 [Hylaeus volcanicus]